MQGTYKKIRKVLGGNNKNKDVRDKIRDKLNEKPENQLSPGMWLTMNPVLLPIITFFLNSNTKWNRT